MSDNVSGRKKVDVGERQRSSRETASGSSDMSVYKSSAEGPVVYKGRKESSVYTASDEYTCDPCSSAGDHLEAEGFCTYCGEYLCGTCFRSHSRGKATKHHKLLNKDNMPRNKIQTCDPCKTAGEEIEAIGYCDDCEEYLCSSCFRSHSRSKATKHHNLMDKDDMPEESYSTVVTPVPKIDINKEDARDQKSIEGYSYVEDINVKATRDAKDCYIIAMTLVTNDKLVLADYENVSLKLVDVASNALKSTLHLKSKPSGLTTVPNDTVAVALPIIHVIQMILVSKSCFVELRNISLMGQCLDIEYRNHGKLYASFHKPVSFQILGREGEVHKTIRPDAKVLKSCAKPRYIAVSPDESMFYVSDWTSDTVMCIDMDGNMISMYQRELKRPKNIVITPLGSVYLCNSNKHVIYKMTPDLSEATMILGAGDGLAFPYAMCFNFSKQHLYISSACDRAEICNHIKVFKW